ncbi:hypothetical protein KO529_09445 [Arenibacter algicola]|uniref:hypothetical protein n=1 Tax=Arenibacter algicola TaxID=616991 RepID=UPI001C06D7F9|nr:hypothetical protein [Arenibacter algicola]MBU2905006.1 hypothetical protein [Arenibacter algicola]
MICKVEPLAGLARFPKICRSEIITEKNDCSKAMEQNLQGQEDLAGLVTNRTQNRTCKVEPLARPARFQKPCRSKNMKHK